MWHRNAGHCFSLKIRLAEILGVCPTPYRQEYLSYIKLKDLNEHKETEKEQMCGMDGRPRGYDPHYLRISQHIRIFLKHTRRWAWWDMSLIPELQPEAAGSMSSRPA